MNILVWLCRCRSTIKLIQFKVYSFIFWLFKTITTTNSLKEKLLNQCNICSWEITQQEDDEYVAASFDNIFVTNNKLYYNLINISYDKQICLFHLLFHLVLY